MKHDRQRFPECNRVETKNITRKTIDGGWSEREREMDVETGCIVVLTFFLDLGGTVLDFRGALLAAEQLLLHLTLWQLRSTVGVHVHLAYTAP